MIFKVSSNPSGFTVLWREVFTINFENFLPLWSHVARTSFMSGWVAGGIKSGPRASMGSACGTQENQGTSLSFSRDTITSHPVERRKRCSVWRVDDPWEQRKDWNSCFQGSHSSVPRPPRPRSPSHVGLSRSWMWPRCVMIRALLIRVWHESGNFDAFIICLHSSSSPLIQFIFYWCTFTIPPALISFSPL